MFTAFMHGFRNGPPSKLAHPDGGFLMDVGDGLLLSKVGSALVGFHISTNSSP